MLGAGIHCAPAALSDHTAPIPALLARAGRCPVLLEQSFFHFMASLGQGGDVGCSAVASSPRCQSFGRAADSESVLVSTNSSGVVLWSH